MGPADTSPQNERGRPRLLQHPVEEARGAPGYQRGPRRSGDGAKISLCGARYVEVQAGPLRAACERDSSSERDRDLQEEEESQTQWPSGLKLGSATAIGSVRPAPVRRTANFAESVARLTNTELALHVFRCQYEE